MVRSPHTTTKSSSNGDRRLHLRLLSKLLGVAMVCMLGASLMLSSFVSTQSSSAILSNTAISADEQPQAIAANTNSTLVFVYGTLKQGLSNYRVYLEPAIAMHKAQFVGAGETMESDLCLVVIRDPSPSGGNELVPCMFEHPSLTGLPSIQGEVYSVDDDELNCMDTMEGVNKDDYYRKKIPVLLHGSGHHTLECFVYLQKFNKEFLDQDFIMDYTSQLDQSYVPWSDVPDLDALSFLYGKDKMDQLQQRMADGTA